MIKSQDDLNTCNDGHRSSDVLVATIEKCEKLEAENKRLKRQLEIALLELNWAVVEVGTSAQSFAECVNKTLSDIKELEK
jgi:hypothetical protein